jgi:sec-independent protein translocase protein TatB
VFDPGFWEVTVIAVLGLLILGPERLPVVAKKVGYWVGKGRRYLSSVRSDIEREFRTDELEKILNQQSTEIEELKDLISDTKKEATDVVQETKELLETSLNTEEKKKPKTNKKKSASKNKLKKEIGKTSTKKDDGKNESAGKD